MNMVQDLLGRQQLDIASMEKVLTLLGPPEKRYDELSEWRYCLGAEPGWSSMDNVWLSIHFREGVVDRVRVVPD